MCRADVPVACLLVDFSERQLYIAIQPSTISNRTAREFTLLHSMTVAVEQVFPGSQAGGMSVLRLLGCEKHCHKGQN
jgi:hypothetical protein